jgi:hypothetical protein
MRPPSLNPFKESGLFHTSIGQDDWLLVLSVSIPSRNQVFFIKSKKATPAPKSKKSLNPFKESGLFHPCLTDSIGGHAICLNPFKESGLFHLSAGTVYAGDYNNVSIPSRNQVFFIQGKLSVCWQGQHVSIPSRNQVFFMLLRIPTPACGGGGLNPFKESGLFHQGHWVQDHKASNGSQSLQGIRSFS